MGLRPMVGRCSRGNGDVSSEIAKTRETTRHLSMPRMTLHGNRTSPTRVRTRILKKVHQDMFSLRSRSRWRFFRDLFERARFFRGFRPLRSYCILDRRWRPVRGRIGRHPFYGEAQDSPVRDRMRPFFLNGLGEQEAMMIPASAKNRGVTKQ